MALSVFHYYTAGFGLLQEITHRGVHLAFVLGLIFLVFPHRRALLLRPRDGGIQIGHYLSVGYLGHNFGDDFLNIRVQNQGCHLSSANFIGHDHVVGAGYF